MNRVEISLRVRANSMGVDMDSGALDYSYDLIWPGPFLMGTQVIGTAWELVNLGDGGSGAALALVKNLSYNNVQLRCPDGEQDPFAVLRQNELALWKPYTGVLVAKAIGSASRILVMMLTDQD